jgi:hypothetical protein
MTGSDARQSAEPEGAVLQACRGDDESACTAITPKPESSPPKAPMPTQAEKLTIKQTATGWWTVQRGTVPLSGAMTRRGAEREREMLRRLSLASARRARPRPAVKT